MVYCVGAAPGRAAVVADLGALKRIGSTASVNVVAEVAHGAHGAATRYFLRKGTTLAEDRLAQTAQGAGDPLALQDFIAWAARSWPAHRLLLVICDRQDLHADAGTDVPRRHGIAARGWVDQRTGLADRRRAPPTVAAPIPGTWPNGFAPAAARWSNPGSTRRDPFVGRAAGVLDSAAIKRVLLRARGAIRQTIDVVGMDSGLPATIEVAHQLRGCAHYLVGSEQSAGGNGWPYHTVLAALAARPQMTAAALATLIVRNYLAAYAAHDGVTQSALALARSVDATAAVGSLARALQGATGHAATQLAIMQARAQAQCYADPDTVDLGDLCDRLQATIGIATPVGRACQSVLAAIEGDPALVVASGRKGAALRYSRGVAIHFPLVAVAPPYAKLDFARASGWSVFLRTYIAQTRRRTRPA